MFTPQGFQPETTDQVIAEINDIFVTVFGSGWNTNVASVNGQFVNQLANMQINNNNFMTTLTASLSNPNVASGIWLDSLCSFNGITRQPATYTTVTCTCNGSAGIVIPAGTQIADTDGNVYANNSAGTIGSGGTVDIVFTAVVSGAIPALAGTVNNIINKVYGWDSVNNSANGILGAPVESDNNLRENRTNLLATYGSASLSAIYSGMYQVDGVTDVKVEENNTLLPITIGGVTIQPGYVYVAVIGGTDNNVAGSLYDKKTPGIPMQGNTTVSYINPEWNTAPVNIIFQRPTAVPLQVNITVVNNSSFPPDISFLIQNTIVNNFNGQDPNVPLQQPVKIGQVINVAQFYPSLLAIGVYNIQVLTIQAVIAGTPTQSIQLNIDSIATLIAANVVVILV